MLRCGIFLLSPLFLANSLFAAPELSLDLEPIIITKGRVHLKVPYSLEAVNLKNSSGSFLESLSILPLDLQSRSPRQDIQADFSLRGSNFQGVLLLLDGQRINDPQTAHFNCDIPITGNDIEKIQVIPGVSSSLYGPDAIGGAINVIVKKPKENNIILELGAGNFQTKSGVFSVTQRKADLGIRVSAERQESGGFHYDTDFKKFTTRLDSSLDLASGEFNLGLGYQEKEFGAYDFYTPGLGYPSFEWTRTYLVDTDLVLDKDGLVIKPSFLWRRHYDKFMLDKTQQRSSYLNHHRTDMFVPGIYFQKDTTIFGKIGMGFEYAEEEISSTNLGDHSRKHQSLFFDDSRDLTSKLALGLSARMDDFQGFNQVYTGSLNFRYTMPVKESLHFGISNSMRVPSFTELYYNDPVTLGNDGLSAEHALNYEFGYGHKDKRLSFGTALFYRYEEDFIDWIKRTQAATKWQVENIVEAKAKGIEQYLRWNISERSVLDFNYTYIDKQVDDCSYLYKYGPNYIRHLFNNSLHFNLPFGTQAIGCFIGATYKKKPHRDGWLLLNSRLSYNPQNNSEIFLKVTNLFNVEYQEIEGIPQPGRWLEAGFEFRW